jgi:hypothetical protein
LNGAWRTSQRSARYFKCDLVGHDIARGVRLNSDSDALRVMQIPRDVLPQVSGLKNPVDWATTDRLAKFLTPENTEILNRPAIGLSMAAGTISTFVLNMREAQASGMFHEDIVRELDDMLEQTNVESALQVLNSQDHPTLARF